MGAGFWVSSFLLLDANTVIQLFKSGAWQQVAANAEILIARTVLGECRCQYDAGSTLGIAKIRAPPQAASVVQSSPAVSRDLHPGLPLEVSQYRWSLSKQSVIFVIGSSGCNGRTVGICWAGAQACASGLAVGNCLHTPIVALLGKKQVIGPCLAIARRRSCTLEHCP